MFDTIKLKREIAEWKEKYNTLENKYETLKDKRIDVMIDLLSKDDTCKRQAQRILQLESIVKTQKEIIEGIMYEKRIKRKAKRTMEK